VNRWRAARMVRRRNRQFSQCLNSTFTVRKNSRFHPYLCNRINRAAIVGPKAGATVTVRRTPARPNVSSTSHVDMEFNPMKNLIARFVKDESGATAIEYGLIAAGISVVIIVAVNGIGTTLNTKFQFISTQLK
jgi:pilus assembly protein Flp/PilA